jgi:hypothetical protein
MSPMLKATTFHNEIRSGSSLPLLVSANDAQRYVVKPYGSGDGVLASMVEWLACKLGILLGLPILEPTLLSIDQTLSKQVKDPETKELIEKSLGINLATRYLEGAFTYTTQFAEDLDKTLKADIFLADLFLLNTDRTLRNPNMLIHNGAVWCLDYSSCFTVRSCIDGKTYQENVLLPQLKKHVFYDPQIYAGDFIKRIRSISSPAIISTVHTLPSEWIKSAKRDFISQKLVISQRLLEKKSQADILYQRLEILKTIRLETPEEEGLRLLKNRQDLEAKFRNL